MLRVMRSYKDNCMEMRWCMGYQALARDTHLTEDFLADLLWFAVFWHEHWHWHGFELHWSLASLALGLGVIGAAYRAYIS